MADQSNWIVVADFDGTLTKKDVGNELCDLFSPQKYRALQAAYRAKKMNLRDYQKDMWTGFPCSEAQFRQDAARLGELRAGVNEFLEKCGRAKIPVYIASCGIFEYIDEVVKTHISAWAAECIKEIHCNTVKFSNKEIVEIITPDPDPSSPVPLHKGKLCKDLSAKHGGAKVLAIGNGSSDQSFVGYTDAICACDKFIDYCKETNTPHTAFEDFRDLYNLEIFN